MEFLNLVSVVLQYLSTYSFTDEPQALTGINLGELRKFKTIESRIMCISACACLELSRKLQRFYLSVQLPYLLVAGNIILQNI